MPLHSFWRLDDDPRTRNNQRSHCHDVCRGDSLAWLEHGLMNLHTAGEAIEAAGLNYQVDLKDIETIDGIPIKTEKSCNQV